MDLIADIGGTHSRCALIDDRGRLIAVETYENHEFDGVHAVLDHYLARRRLSDRPHEAALAIAGPITGDRVAMTNLPWRFSQRKLCKALGLQRLVVVNDFAAVAWSLAVLARKDLQAIGGGKAVLREPLAVLGPGSGLGVAVLVPVEGSWTVLAGEGGNIGLATTTPAEATVVDTLRDSDGYCAAETLISGPGLVRIHTILTDRAGQEAQTLTPAAISAAAARGDRLAIEAREMFFGLLGSLAGDIALTAGARGGVYVAGGIIPRLLKPFAASAFRARFEAKGRYRSYLAAIPTYVITADAPALMGLRKILGHR
jgi:glucokinase